MKRSENLVANALSLLEINAQSSENVFFIVTPDSNYQKETTPISDRTLNFFKRTDIKNQ